MTARTATRKAPSEADRHALLVTARTLARHHSLTELTPDLICKEAGQPPDRFRVVWPDQIGFERELLAELLDEVRDTVAKNISGMPPGISRLKLAIEAYLEANRARPTVRALALKLQTDPAGSAVLRSRIAGFTLMMDIELQALNWPHPAAVARLFTAATLEIAYAEHEAGCVMPDLRTTLFHHFDARRG